MNIKKLALLFATLLLGLTPFAGAQTLLTTTTLAGTVPGMGSVSGATPLGNMSIVPVASATGISAPVPNTSLTPGLIATSEAQTYIYVDRELMQVKAVSGTNITVIRGLFGTSAVAHASGALTFIIPTSALGVWSGGGADSGPQGPSFPQGACTRANEVFLPRIQFSSGTISDCLGGQWINGDAAQTTRNHSKVLYAPQPGGSAYTTLGGTGTAPVAGTLFCTEIQLPYSKLITGLAVLNGTVVGTDNHLVALYDSGGNLLVNSAVAGALAANASTYQQISFTAPFYAVGPAQYFGCAQSNGVTATIRMLATGTQDQYLTTSRTGTFGTVPATITVPTTFTTAVGPYLGIF